MNPEYISDEESKVLSTVRKIEENDQPAEKERADSENKKDESIARSEAEKLAALMKSAEYEIVEKEEARDGEILMQRKNDEVEEPPRA